jgi:hypothetical protein
MTRSGAPFHGASGEGNTESSAASAQLPDAACAGESTVTQRNKAVAAAAANRLAKSILATFLEGHGTARGPASGAGVQDS